MNLYKNLKMKVYLGLILVLASTPVHASLETWAQNLDLTIPLLEMPSTSALDLKDKQEIMMGFECCWDQKLIEAVKKEHFLKSIEYKLKENPRKSQFTHQFEFYNPPTNKDWAAFVTLQLLDVYTTYRGVKYDCVEEANPLFGKRPSIGKMLAGKALILAPAIKLDLENDKLSKASLQSTNNFTTIIVLNNYHVLNNAIQNCNKI